MDGENGRCSAWLDGTFGIREEGGKRKREREEEEKSEFAFRCKVPSIFDQHLNYQDKNKKVLDPHKNKETSFT